MPIVRRKAAEKHLQVFEERAAKLREALKGTEPNANLSDHYALNADDYKRDFIEIDAEDFSYAISDIEGSARELKKFSKQKEPKLHRS